MWVGIGPHIGYLERGAGAGGSGEDRIGVQTRTVALEHVDQLVGHPVRRPVDQLGVRLVQLEDGAAVGARKADGVGQDGRQDFLKVERRRHRLANLGECALLLDRPPESGGTVLKLLEEPGVLDGDDGLGGERLQERDLFVGERVDDRAVYDQDADRRRATNQWDATTERWPMTFWIGSESGYSVWTASAMSATRIVRPSRYAVADTDDASALNPGRSSKGASNSPKNAGPSPSWTRGATGHRAREAGR